MVIRDNIRIRGREVSTVNGCALNRRADLEAVGFLVALLAEVERLHDLGGGVGEDCHVDCSVRLLVGGVWRLNDYVVCGLI